ncbi:hypothetical protein QYF61_007353 [Mycteria americana]|uniref:Uncharacterized protein n=1 Tax=Mycteria americana TaxID=33587 RepID=A0AAN7RVS2_MYCAM|nr:hypothetical protein QYF61_007353 [Mycteria americana]
MSQHCALEANGILGCIRRGVAERLRKFWALQYKREMGLLERVQRTDIPPEHEETLFLLVRKGQALCTSVFAARGLGCQESSGGQRLCHDGQQEPAAAGRAVWRHQKTTHAPSAQEMSTMWPTWPCASITSALAASSSGPRQELCVHSAGSLSIVSCGHCEQTMTTKRMELGLLPAARGTWPGRGPRVNPHSKSPQLHPVQIFHELQALSWEEVTCRE